MLNYHKEETILLQEYMKQAIGASLKTSEENVQINFYENMMVIF